MAKANPPVVSDFNYEDLTTPTDEFGRANPAPSDQLHKTQSENKTNLQTQAYFSNSSAGSRDVKAPDKLVKLKSAGTETR